MPAATPGPDAAWPCLQGHGRGACLDLVVSANARHTLADGLHAGALRVRLAAPPVDGKANALLLAWLAAELDLPQRGVQLLRGAASRRKRVLLDAPTERVAQWLAASARA